MSYQTQADATARAVELCPKGWDTRVWENLGWHVCWCRGPVAVYEASFGGFYALLADDLDGSGAGGPWTGLHYTSSDTIEDAAENSIKAFRAYVKAEKERWAAIDAQLWA